MKIIKSKTYDLSNGYPKEMVVYQLLYKDQLMIVKSYPCEVDELIKEEMIFEIFHDDISMMTEFDTDIYGRKIQPFVFSTNETILDDSLLDKKYEIYLRTKDLQEDFQ